MQSLGAVPFKFRDPVFKVLGFDGTSERFNDARHGSGLARQHIP
jgi:hypothetical protein